MNFQNKVALVTGGGNGIGRATALGFAGRGAKVVIVDRDASGGEATAGVVRQQGGEALFVQADVTNSADVQAYVSKAVGAFVSRKPYSRRNSNSARASRSTARASRSSRATPKPSTLKSGRRRWRITICW